jgi:hypothetical protein
MFQSESVELELRRCGYLHLDAPDAKFSDIYRRSVYRASWSSGEVEHFIYLGNDIKDHKYFVGKFGIRCPIVEKFSTDSLVTHGHANYGLFRDRYGRDEASCALTYDFQRFNWARKKVEPRIFLPNADPVYMARFISAFVDDRLLPAIGHITSSEEFFAFLLEDTEPCRWFATNPAVRAAQVAALGSHLGVEDNLIRRSLEPYERPIAKNLFIARSDDPKSCVDWYVHQLAADWARRAN